MRKETRALVADFKAAARIGHPQSLQAAMDRFRALPEVAGNQPLSEAFVDQVLLPIGQILASPLVPVSLLRPWLDDPLTGVRAVAAAGLGIGTFKGKKVPSQDLLRVGRDARVEVRRALAVGLAQGGAGDAHSLLAVLSPWLSDPSPRLRQTALLALASAAPAWSGEQGEGVLALLEPLRNDPDPEARGALVTALVALADAGLAGQILDRLAAWAEEPGANFWVIARVLSASWAAGHAQKVLAILEELEAQTGSNSQINNARRALERHRKS